MKIHFPLYRYHPPEDMGPGRVGTLKLYSTPFPVRPNIPAYCRSIIANEPQYVFRSRPESGTQGMGLFQSDYHLSVPQVAPGGLLDASGQDIPIIGYNGADHPRPGLVHFFMGFAEIAGWRYSHHFQFGEPVQLTLPDFKKKLIGRMSASKGFPRPIKAIKEAETFLDIFKIEFGEKRAKHFYKEYEYKQL